jgi:hypothetical protein
LGSQRSERGKQLRVKERSNWDEEEEEENKLRQLIESDSTKAILPD